MRRFRDMAGLALVVCSLLSACGSQPRKAPDGAWILPAGQFRGAIDSARRPTGPGVLLTPEGHTFEGRFVDGMLQGQGVFRWASGARYQGMFVNGNFHGQGERTWANGDRYKGEFANDKAHGFGTYVWASGGRYEGEFQRGQFHGKGTSYNADGSVHTGIYADDKRHGEGQFKAANGLEQRGRYERGEFVEGEMRRGLGYLVTGRRDGACEGRNGDFRWRGECRGFQLHKGERLGSDGQVLGNGEWRDGRLWSGVQLEPNGFTAWPPQGEGLCVHQGQTEPCRFEQSKRADATHLARLEMAALEARLAEERRALDRQREQMEADMARRRAELEAQQRAARAEAQRDERNRKAISAAIGAMKGDYSQAASLGVPGASSLQLAQQMQKIEREGLARIEAARAEQARREQAAAAQRREMEAQIARARAEADARMQALRSQQSQQMAAAQAQAAQLERGRPVATSASTGQSAVVVAAPVGPTSVGPKSQAAQTPHTAPATPATPVAPAAPAAPAAQALVGSVVTSLAPTPANASPKKAALGNDSGASSTSQPQTRVDGDGLYDDDGCVTAVGWCTTSGRAESKGGQLTVRVQNSCPFRLYTKICLQTKDGQWLCGSDGHSPGRHTSYWSSDGSVTGRFVTRSVGSTKGGNDWVCAGKLAGWHDNPR